MFRFLCLFSTKYISLMISQETLGIRQTPGHSSGGACRVSKKLLPPPFMEAPQGGLSCPSGNSPSGGRAKRGRSGVGRVAKCLQRAQNISKIFSFRLNVSRTGIDTAAAFGGAPHQSSPGSEEPGDDSFSPRGEALSVIRRFPGNGIK